jgi:hypothetical protein
MRALLCLVVLMSPACAADDDSDYYPLKPGMKWIYKRGGQDIRFCVAVVGEEKIGAVTCMKLESTLRDALVGIEYVSFGKDGFYRHKYGDVMIEPAVCFCKTGLKKGDTWKVDFKIGPTAASASYRADFADVKVPAGEYKNCLVVRAEITEKAADGEGKNQLTRTTICFAKGVGIVKMTIQPGEGTFEFDLESIEVPKK